MNILPIQTRFVKGKLRIHFIQYSRDLKNFGVRYFRLIQVPFETHLLYYIPITRKNTGTRKMVVPNLNRIRLKAMVPQ